MQAAQSQTVFNQMGTVFVPENTKEKTLHPLLPPGVYKVGQSLSGFYLRESGGFSMPPKVYGDVKATSERVLKTFLDRPNNTGILLEGKKGSGKTLTAKQICIHGVQQGLPVIKVESSFSGPAFNDFIQSITQPCIMLLDEFEKTYDEDSQNALLTLLDGTVSTKKLFVLTCNSIGMISDYMLNRPGRIFYHLSYDGLSLNFIREYCEDNLVDKARIPGLLMVAGTFRDFTFDALKAMVEEMNRYKETAIEVMNVLNISGDSDFRFHIKVYKDGKPLDSSLYDGASITASSPLNLSGAPFRLYGQDTLDELAKEYELEKPLESPFGKKDLRFTLDSTNLKEYNDSGEYCFKTVFSSIEVRMTRQTREVKMFSLVNV